MPARKPETVETLFEKANAALDAGDEPRAVALFTQAIALEPANAAIVQSRGAVKAMMDDEEGAIADYDRAIELAPDYADAYLNRGLAHFETKKYREAGEDLARALELGLRLEEVEVQARYFLGRSREMLGELDQARQVYDALVLFAPGSKMAEDAGLRSVAIMVHMEGESAENIYPLLRAGADSGKKKKNPKAPPKKK